VFTIWSALEVKKVQKKCYTEFRRETGTLQIKKLEETIAQLVETIAQLETRMDLTEGSDYGDGVGGMSRTIKRYELNGEHDGCNRV
jgi:hypothetical protein